MPDHYTPGPAPGTVANSYKSLSVECQEAVVGRLTNELTVEGVRNVGTDKLRDGNKDRAEAIVGKLRAYSDAKVNPPAHLEGLAQGLVPKLPPVTSEQIQDNVLHSMTVAQLREFAARNNIDLTGATVKQEIIDKIEAHHQSLAPDDAAK